MKREHKLITDTMIYGIANFGSTTLAFLMLPIYTSYFTTTEYGLWDLILTTVTLLAPFITFELISAVYRWLLNAEDEIRRKNIITTGFLTIIRNIIIFSGFISIVFIFIPFAYTWESILYLNVIIMTNFIQQCARGLGHNKLFASLGLIQSGITIFLNILLMFVFNLRLETFFYSGIIAGICTIIIAWKSLNFNNYIAIPSYSKQLKKSLLQYSLPIIPGAASWWIMTMSDRYFIIHFLGIEYNGVFAIANKIPALLLMINHVFFLAWKDSAILTFEANNRNEYYKKVFKPFFRLMATSVIMLILLAKPVIAIFISDDFYEAWQYIGVLLCGSLFHTLALFWSAGFHAAKKTKIILTSSLIGAILNIVVNALLIKHLHLYAIAISTIIAFGVVWLIRVIASRNIFTIGIDLIDFAVLLPLILVAMVVSFFVETLGLIICLVLAVLLFILYNKELINFLIRKLFMY